MDQAVTCYADKCRWNDKKNKCTNGKPKILNAKGGCTAFEESPLEAMQHAIAFLSITDLIPLDAFYTDHTLQRNIYTLAKFCNLRVIQSISGENMFVYLEDDSRHKLNYDQILSKYEVTLEKNKSLKVAAKGLQPQVR